MVYREKIKLQSRDRAVSFHDVTEQVKEAVKRSGVKDGIAVVYSHHTTCSVITQECAFDMSMTGLETLQQDLVNVFEEWIPTCRYEGMYLHPGRKALDFAESVGEDNFGHRQKRHNSHRGRHPRPRRLRQSPLHRLGPDKSPDKIRADYDYRRRRELRDT